MAKTAQKTKPAQPAQASPAVTGQTAGRPAAKSAAAKSSGTDAAKQAGAASGTKSPGRGAAAQATKAPSGKAAPARSSAPSGQSQKSGRSSSRSSAKSSKAASVSPDIRTMVDSVRGKQLSEGNFDCFARAVDGYCDQDGCCFRSECLDVSALPLNP